MKADELQHIKEEIVDLTSEVIRISSFATKETPAAEYMRDLFEDHGF